MIKESESLKEVWTWKEKAYREVKDLPNLEDKIKKRLENINKKVMDSIITQK